MDDILVNKCGCFLQDEQKALDEILAKRSKKGKQVEEKPVEEKTTLHSK